MKTHSLLFFFLIVCIASLLEAQTETAIHRAAQGKTVSSDEMVSFKSDVPYTKAIQALGELSKKLEGKLVIDRSPLQGKDKAIGINIESMYWKDALELILRSNQLWYNDYPEYLEIVTFEEVGKSLSGGPAQPGGTRSPSDISSAVRVNTVVDSSEYYSQIHEVSISGIFFDLNKTKMTESGMSFHIFRGNDLNLGVNLEGKDLVTQVSQGTQLFSTTVAPTGSSMPVTMDAAIALFDQDKLGEIIARPQLTVRSGSSAQIQVGADFSVLEKDFSGNTVQKFYPTGTILTVSPKIMKVGDMEFVVIQYRIEKSTFTTSAGSSVINRTLAVGSLTLLNGEEGYVGGMYSNEENITREGIPLLKDLPWWFFGLRYLFGYNASQVIKRELLVLIKAEILPSVEERAMKPQAVKNIIKESVKEMDKDIEKRTDK